jgi:preprotein translocase subunit SecG
MYTNKIMLIITVCFTILVIIMAWIDYNHRKRMEKIDKEIKNLAKNL